MYQAFNLALQFLNDFAFIVLAAVGLAVIFGIMGVINLAHGEFIMVGAYGTTLTANAGAPLPVAMIAGVLAAAGIGFVVERVIVSGAVPNWIAQKTIGRPVIEPLYDRLFDSMVATWGVSLVMIEGGRIVFGDSLPSIGTPLGSIHYGAFSTSMYGVVLAGASVAVVAGMYVLFTRTAWGRRARATIQDEPMARSLGVDTDRTYMTTFAVGSGLAGLTGALYAPTLSIGPGLGSQFLVEAFVAVVVGGTSVILGTLLGGGVLAAISATVDNLTGNSFFGRIALLVVAILVLRFLPTGVSGLVESVRERRGVNES
ncbi:urea ABC transporter, permease protein UrtB [Halococcoides cellulosivorans]|uniref:urea ABC transporter, permease protein UrtB n=1 Tax=Halococcoides cellulosivorans TaxID=1679096 RepID=UPI0037427B2F